jgi:hypothetical protein
LTNPRFLRKPPRLLYSALAEPSTKKARSTFVLHRSGS